MDVVPFDTLKATQRLEGAGFSGAQAAGLADVMADVMVNSDLATRSDIVWLRAELKGDIASFRSEVNGEIASLRSEMTVQNAALRSELKAENAALRSELKAENAALRSELKAENAALRSELKGDIVALDHRIGGLEQRIFMFRSELKGDMEILRRDLTLKLGSMIFVAVGVILAAMRLMPHP